MCVNPRIRYWRMTLRRVGGTTAFDKANGALVASASIHWRDGASPSFANAIEYVAYAFALRQVKVFACGGMSPESRTKGPTSTSGVTRTPSNRASMSRFFEPITSVVHV